MGNHKTFQFVGGSHDGAHITMNGAVSKGMEIPMPPPAPGGRPEIYVLDDKGFFRFDRHGLINNPRIGTKEALEELSPVLGRMATVLDDMEKVLAKYGGPSLRSQYRVGNWKFRHKDA